MSRRGRGLRMLASLITMLAIFVLAACSKGTDFPSKAITMIIPWTAGSASDLAIRYISSYAEKELGQPITPVNKVGSNGSIAWAEAAKAPKDGYTMAFLTFDILTNQALKTAPTKWTDFDLIMQFTIQPMGLYVHKDSPYKTMQEFVAGAKANPGKLKVGTTALGGLFHQAGTLLEEASGISMNYVPYQGSAEILTATLGKHLDASINTLTLPAQHVQEGTLRLLAVFSADRYPGHPDVPTLKEQGYDVTYESWRGVAVPKGTPQEIRDKLHDAFKKAFDNSEFKEGAAKQKLDLFYRGPADFTKFVEEAYPDVEKVVLKLNPAKQ